VIEWVGEHMDSLIVMMMVLQGFVMARMHAKAVRERLRVERELVEAWEALAECAKVLHQREDFDSRNVHRRIYRLAAKYRPPLSLPEGETQQ
jgi:hypothetical protein